MIAEKMNLLKYLEKLQSQGQYWFIRQDAIDTLHLSPTAFRKAAYLLIGKGKLHRIRANFYLITPPEYRAIGSLPASWFIDALMKHMNQNYYVALLTAASLHNAAHQQPMIFQVITDKITRPIRVGNVHIQFYYKKSILPYYYQSIKTSTGSMNVSSFEMTAYDLVRYMKVSGQLNNVATVLAELSPSLSIENLAMLLRKHDIEASTAQRLGYILEQITETPQLHLLAKIIKNKNPSATVLVPGIKNKVFLHNKRWNILVNETLALDDL